MLFLVCKCAQRTRRHPLQTYAEHNEPFECSRPQRLIYTVRVKQKGVGHRERPLSARLCRSSVSGSGAAAPPSSWSSCSSPTRHHITSPSRLLRWGGRLRGRAGRQAGSEGEGPIVCFWTRRKKTAQTRRPPFKARRASTVAQPSVRMKRGDELQEEDNKRWAPRVSSAP